MPVPRISEKDLFNHDEMALFTLTQSAESLRALSPSQLRSNVSRARTLRDRARTLYRKQVGRIQTLTGLKRGYTGMANERSRQKAEALSNVVEALVTARDQQLATG